MTDLHQWQAICSAVSGPSFIGVNTSSCIPANIAKAPLAADLSLLIVLGRGVESSMTAFLVGDRVQSGGNINDQQFS